MSITAKEKLRSGMPVWMAYPRRMQGTYLLSRELKTDVRVGAGISGALVAYTLAREGHRVVVIDRHGLLTGSSPPASTALLLFEIDTPLIHLKGRIGARPAERAWLRSKGALDAL